MKPKFHERVIFKFPIEKEKEKMRKIIQITTFSGSSGAIVALCDDSTIWILETWQDVKSQEWKHIAKPIPQKEIKDV